MVGLILGLGLGEVDFWCKNLLNLCHPVYKRERQTMIKTHCHTNLDISGMEKFPDEMPEAPRVGDLIRSATVYPRGYQLELEVCRCTWYSVDTIGPMGGQQLEWRMDVELHLPPHRYNSISDFEKKYDKMRNS